ncbi:UNVERIFIED_CONTAM: hypothetical protein GTU68_031910 [Idotea baltica]|nr:hypothetical protein [Idotea baltica]
MATLISIPLGTLLGAYRFRGRDFITGILNALMGLPPVVVGLALYLLLSRTGPLGDMQLLFTSSAMIIAQCILITPIISSLTQQTIEDLFNQHELQFKALGAPTSYTLLPLLRDARTSLFTAILAGFGRASAEVGAVLIVGGNINHLTRVMTTTIALETSKGNLELAMALGIILLIISFTITSLMIVVRKSQSV